MTWGTVIIGGISFREELEVEETAESLRIHGQESTPVVSYDQVMTRHQNVTSMLGKVMPVVFTDKTELSGFYTVSDASSTLMKYANGAITTMTWSVELEKLGTAQDVEFESRVPTVPRSTELTGTTVSYWHAPPGGHTSYYTGPTVPDTSVTREGSSGTMLVFTGIPADVPPRWTVSAENYLNGASRVYLNGERFIGDATPQHTTWEVHNSLVRVAPVGAGIAVSTWEGGAWRSVKDYVFTVSGATLTVVPEFTIMRNDPEEVTVRLSYAISPGRVTVDLSLRRGSRFVTGVIKRHSSATLGVARTTAEAATAVTGGLRATSVDADGNRFVMGSTRTVTTVLDTASISKASSVQLDFFLGHEVDATPATGDAFADLLAQYRGTNGDRTRVIRR